MSQVQDFEWAKLYNLENGDGKRLPSPSEDGAAFQQDSDAINLIWGAALRGSSNCAISRGH